MRVLVSGAGGFLGRHLVERLVKGDHQVRAIIRPASPAPLWAGQVEIFRADLRVPDNLISAFANIDAVIHAAAATTGDENLQFASTVVGTENFLNAMAQTPVKRLIHVSSLVVYDWSQAKTVLDEDTALRKDIYEMGGYTIAKTWQERVVKGLASSHLWDLTIMRPGFIWGPQHEEIAGMGRRFGRVRVMFGPCTRLPLCHVVNCADCIVVALENPGSVGQTFNAIDSDAIRVGRYVREYGARTGQRAWLIPLPYYAGLGMAHVAAFASRTLFGKKGKLPSLLVPHRYESQFKPLRFSNRKLTELLGWVPPLSFEECLSETYTRQ
jgi:nucleoside-diphosphate-sugar epimerase